MKTTTISLVCDNCGRNVKDGEKWDSTRPYRLVLSLEFTSLLHQNNLPIDRDHHFCDLSCLTLWADRRRPVQ